ncbi:MAG: xanthine dehydrogenase family protein [Deltaproteobacteria bacterium]|nr:xanthine dehydrogenase family protein [Deltaproteobacteria bacterium]
MKKRTPKAIGRVVPRKEGRAKVTGEAKYIDDINRDDLWHGATIRSSVARGSIRKITFDPKIPWKEFCVVTAKDIPGKNVVALIEGDQPLLAETRIEHPEEPVLLIAHPNKEMVTRARATIQIEYAAAAAVLDFEKSDTVFKSYSVNKGDVDSVFRRKDVTIVEETYFTGAQEQLYIEMNGVIAQASSQTGVTVWGSMQCPYYVHKALKALFQLPDDRVRVIQTETGGGFGGKEEYPSMIAGHAALLAWKCGHPVKLIYDRAEDMAATTKRHPSRTRHRTAVDKNGKLLAVEIDFLLDGGAYVTLSPVVLSRGTIHAAGPYLCDNVRVQSRVVKTNTPPHGAFRGFGAPQSLFAVEKHMDRIARVVGVAPEEIRRRNFLKTGGMTATSQVIQQKLDLSGLLDKALKKSNWKTKREKFLKHNKTSKIKKGLGLATFLHGAGFTGSGERVLASKVAVEGTEKGTIRVLTANTEIGQGTNTIFAQVVSDALKIPYEWVEVAQPDTARVPNSGPTVASRTCMIVGKLVERAALELEGKLIDSGLLEKNGEPSQFRKALVQYRKKYGELKGFAEYIQPSHVNWDDQLYRGDAYGAFAWAAYIAEVSVDTVTYCCTVDRFTAVQEVGRVVHPLLAEGQIIGGVTQGIGYALYERVVWKDGRMANNSLTNYIIPTSVDTPTIDVIFLEEPYEPGPGGAKGIGELPLDGPAPAILNAIENALGVEVNHIPLLPEDLLRVCEAGR